MFEFEILGSSKAIFFLCTHKLFLVFCQLHKCIVSLTNAQKHVFGMYVFVYLAICILGPKVQCFIYYTVFSSVHWAISRGLRVTTLKPSPS